MILKNQVGITIYLWFFAPKNFLLNFEFPLKTVLKMPLKKGRTTFRYFLFLLIHKMTIYIFLHMADALRLHSSRTFYQLHTFSGNRTPDLGVASTFNAWATGRKRNQKDTITCFIYFLLWSFGLVPILNNLNFTNYFKKERERRQASQQNS